ncbi:MAG: DUF1294 domain-containing protein [Sulfurospirillum sp.]|nr:DUF1294 domain-containing protein [Sulfurospirillum sp.]
MCCNSFRILFLFAFVFIAYFGNNTLPNIPVVLWYLVSINIFAFFLTAIDKLNAIKNAKRVSEANFIFFAIAGGVLGILLSMFAFKHKIQKKVFLTVLLLIALFWFVSIFLVLQNLDQIQNALHALTL